VFGILTRQSLWIGRIDKMAKKVKQPKAKAGEVTPQGFTVPTKEDLKAGEHAPDLRGRNRGRGR
tara:strand:- start:72 stop:263 length:192 start_codon:yes stop_codon:yes gene_type:complete